jgi:hypothetical protein
MTDMSEVTKLETAEDMADSYFRGLVNDPTSVELVGYIEDCSDMEGGVNAFCNKLQHLLGSFVQAGAEKKVIVDHPLVEDNIADSLMNLTAYSTFLTDIAAQGGTGEPGPQLQHGQYLAQRVLQDGLERLKQIQATQAAE